MQNGFTIRCDVCGIEVKFASNDTRIISIPDRQYDRNITHYECDCGNKANSDEDY